MEEVIESVHKGSRVVVTGSEGHIATALIYDLVDKGFDVVGVDINGAGFGKCDLSDPNDEGWEVIRSHKPDTIFHLAALIRVDESEEFPAMYYRHNVSSTINLLSVMRDIGCKQLVFASSAAVYASKDTPIAEFDQKIPESVYGSTKLMCENIIANCCDSYGLRAINFRFFNAAGYPPHEAPIHLIPIILDRVKHNKDVYVYGTNYPTFDGTCVRDYVHVDDLSSAMIAAHGHLVSKSGPRGYCVPVNLGTGTGYTVSEVISAAMRLCGSDYKGFIVNSDPRNGDPPCLVANTARAKELLNWHPKKGLDSMILDTLAESAS